MLITIGDIQMNYTIKLKIINSNKQRKVTAFTKNKISKSLLGIKHSDKFKKRRSDLTKGINNYFYGKHFFGALNPNYAKKLSEKEPSKPSAAGPALRRNNGIRR